MTADSDDSIVQWEYLEVQLNSYNSGGGNGQVKFDGGEEQIESSCVLEWMSSIEACPNHFGKEGWDLVKMGATVRDSSENKWFLFKRQK